MERQVNTYWSLEDWVSHCENDPVPSHRVGDNENHTPARDSWDGGVGYSGALDLAREGWDGPLDQVERLATHVESKVDLSLFQTEFEAVRDVAGSEVDIDKYLIGDPECMIESTPLRISRQGRAVRVVVPISYNGGTNTQKVLNRGAAVVALCDLLARAQHPVEVWGTVTAATFHGGSRESGNKPSFVDQVRIQAADEPLDVGRLLAVIAHPAIFRRLGFRSIEQIESPQLARAIGGGYGHGCDPLESDLPDQAENTFVLSHLVQSDPWDEAQSARWITEILDKVFG